MVDQARLSALSALDRVLKEGSYSNLAAKDAYERLELKERAFFARLFYGTLDKLITIDWVLEHYLEKRTQSTVKNILRLSVYQIYYMDAVPDFAACDAAVELAKARGKGGASGFINAVLRKVAKEKGSLDWPPRKKLVEHLSVRYSFPRWMVGLWVKELGEETCEVLLSYEAETDSITIRPNKLRDMDAKRLSDMLENKGFSYRQGDFVEDAFHVTKGGSLITHEWFKQGRFTVQGEASMLLAKVAMASNPQRVWDCCASPGGKTAAMASIADEAITFRVSDVHAHRVKLIGEQFRRLGVQADIFRHDAVKPLGREAFDLVLVDAPCSGLGTLWAQGDIKESKSFDDVMTLSEVQRNILDNVCNHVKVGGKLLYATCTISRRENEGVVTDFLAKHEGYRLVDLPYGLQQEGKIGRQFLPSEDHMEGFYMALLERVS